MAGVALLTSVSLLTGLAYALPASAADPLPDNPGSRITFGEKARADRCEVGFALHLGGPSLKAATVTALNGTDADLAAALFRRANIYPSPLDDALREDRQSSIDYVHSSGDRKSRWEAANKVYAETGWDSGTSYHAPEFDAGVVAFTLGAQEELYDRFGQDGRSVPGTESVAAAKKLAESLSGKAPLGDDSIAATMLRDSSVKPPNNGTTASDIARYLRHGGFPSQEPVEGSAEYRMEVESLKVSWSDCDSWNPVDPRRFLGSVTATAYAEWEQEYAAQAKPRADIMAAEVAASAEARKTTEAMIESIGQAWLAEQILLWQKYWAGQPKESIHRPKAAVFTQAKTDLANAQKRAADQLTLANKAVAAAKTASDKANTAQNSAYAIADAARTPRGRGLLYAQQSVQVAKASYAAAQAAAKATQTAVNAAKATVADSRALFALSKTQAHAINTEFRRVAAQEAAAQAKSAAASAEAQAKEAAENATKAQTAQATAEKAQETARVAAETAKTQRAKAEQERDLAAKERRTAADERAKARAAEQRAANERETAGHARTQAEGAAKTADEQLTVALLAEGRAAAAREKAEKAQRDKNATASRAGALESAAAAAVGTSAAAETREAAIAARTAANDAAGAATRERAAAGEAVTAAQNARAAATRADAAAQRSRAAADKAWSAYQTAVAAGAVAHAAAAEAIDASDAASANAAKAEQEAKKAQAAALKASQEADAARAEAARTSAWAAVTAGHAYAAGQAASAARDSAAEVIKPARTAIAGGTPYRESDSSAAFAVLIGQTALSLSEQQAAAATAKAKEAAKAAADAKALADKAAGDAKLAAQAAAAAAADAAAALKSMAAAQASATKAAKAAEAAKKADARTKEYVAQAGSDWAYADSAARGASSEAAEANNEATEAEKSATNARASADAATLDAGAADSAATGAEEDAVAAEKSAANANQDAKEADEAADRAEEEFRKRQEEERKAALDAPRPDTGPDLTQDDEALLLAHCGQPCVDEFRKAKQLLAMDVIDWVIANGGQILLDELGYTEAKKCFTQPDVESCLWTLVNVIMLGAGVAKIPGVTKAIYRVSSGIHSFWEGLDKAKDTLDRLRTVLDRVKKGQSAVACLAPIVEGAAAQRAAARMAAAAAAGDKPKVCVTSALGKESRLAKLAEEATKNQDVQREMNSLINKLMEGNDQPGKGSKALPHGIRYLRGHKGARLFFREVKDGFEIIGKSDKDNEPNVIKELLSVYGS
ncbi:hypothetical protein [Streptomyces lacrimifluminis]|uniref:Methyl-accepting transducer domain-containing protein n=1 Tax=Streptomyces lacrimifluminis TaxID=1500077 RepID=A0A917NSL9_9ACTN|nr:hypothetical protein [Streptomyces lacrimifluminis]GGJ20977.1 hypothetical protein GCM10012282_16710 [Streptomyces lacrimifluminis]